MNAIPHRILLKLFLTLVAGLVALAFMLEDAFMATSKLKIKLFVYMTTALSMPLIKEAGSQQHCILRVSLETSIHPPLPCEATRDLLTSD